VTLFPWWEKVRRPINELSHRPGRKVFKSKKKGVARCCPSSKKRTKSISFRKKGGGEEHRPVGGPCPFQKRKEPRPLGSAKSLSPEKRKGGNRGNRKERERGRTSPGIRPEKDTLKKKKKGEGMGGDLPRKGGGPSLGGSFVLITGRKGDFLRKKRRDLLSSS